MPIDASIYSQIQNPDFVGSVERGMKIGDQVDARNRDLAARQAYQKNISVNPDGTTKVNRAGLVGDMYRIDAARGMDTEDRFAKQDQAKAKASLEQLDATKANLEMTAGLWANVHDQASHDLARETSIKLGLAQPDKIGEVYDPQKASTFAGMYMKGADVLAHEKLKLEQSNAVRDQQNKDRDYGLKQQEIGIKKQEAAGKIASGQDLPIDSKHFVDTLATKNANKVAIRSQIDSVVANWDNLPDDQKVTAGRQLIKTLNSTEGSDAVGNEEAKRLGGKLEFAMGNLGNSNPTQFGRDLSGFKEQAQLVSKAISGAVKTNEGLIDEKMGRKSQQKVDPNMKVVQGKTYMRVRGGWEEQ